MYVLWYRKVIHVMCGELAEGGGGKQLPLKLTACHKWGPQGWNLGPTVLSALTNGVDDGI